MPEKPYLSEIYIYPIKSCAGIKVNNWRVTKKGLLFDRKWMLIDQDHKFITQRTKPEMTLISTTLSYDELILSAPGLPNITLPLNSKEGEQIEVAVWQDSCIARRVSKEVDQWLGEFLEIKCSLVYQPKESIRRVDPTYATPNDQVNFSDGFPFLIISENSLSALNREMKLDLSIVRFRPNLVIGDCECYAEDYWRNVSIGEIKFRLPKPCSRCPIPSIDPETGQKDKEPLRTLNRLRKWKNKVYFGQNAVHDGVGRLKTGDPVIITKSGLSQPAFNPN